MYIYVTLIFNYSLFFLCEGVVGVDETVKRGHCKTLNERNKVISILTLAEKAGMSTGFVTTARATHATPSALYAHSADRGWESDTDMRRKAKDDPSNCTDIGKVKRVVRAVTIVQYEKEQI